MARGLGERCYDFPQVLDHHSTRELEDLDLMIAFNLWYGSEKKIIDEVEVEVLEFVVKHLAI